MVWSKIMKKNGVGALQIFCNPNAVYTLQPFLAIYPIPMVIPLMIARQKAPNAQERAFYRIILTDK